MSAKRRRRRRHTMDIILIIMGVLLVAFTVCMVYLFIRFQAVPDALISSFFATFGAEGGFMAVIMVAKKLTEGKDEEHQETDL